MLPSPSPVTGDARTLACTPPDAETTEALAFEATYDHGFLEVHLQANVKAGVLVVASLNRFVDDSGRSSYFTREFYYRPGRHQGLRP